jgi:hypothetical protein
VYLPPNTTLCGKEMASSISTQYEIGTINKRKTRNFLSMQSTFILGEKWQIFMPDISA